MPELPEVETVRRGLAPVFDGQRLSRVIARRPDLRFPIPDGFGQRLTGRVVTKVGRRAKYLLVHCDDGTVLIWHLGMSGRVQIFEGDAPPEEKHDHVIFETEAGATVRFNDTRRFGFVDLSDEDNLEQHASIKKLGPEPLGEDFSAKVLFERLKGRRTPIKAALLDQGIVSGLGYIYVSECLFRSGIAPTRLSNTIKPAQCAKLYDAIQDVLNEAIAAGGSSLKDHRQTNGDLGYFQHSFKVYDQAGKPCPNSGCKKTIEQITQSGRSTFFCAKCQR